MSRKELNPASRLWPGVILQAWGRDVLEWIDGIKIALKY